MATSFPPPDDQAPIGASSLTSSAFMLSSRFHTDDTEDGVDSLPSGSASDSSLGADYYSDEESDAEEEWRESMEQLEMLLTMVIIPFLGKFLGRKCAYWGWNKFMEWKYPVEVVIGNSAIPHRTRKQKVSASL
ncbi:hypothetical protein VTO42DRAFT_3477 [Malbranchea cinnamomea]